MALDPVRLDDLTWEAMMAAIRRHIPAASDGDWTLHAPVDPGVTMLELFAWLLEQRVYWMDQVSDPLVRAALSLLGERPIPTRFAATVMQFNAQKFEGVPRLTELRLAESTPSVIFSTGMPLELLRINRIGIFVNGQDRTHDLEMGRTFRMFPANGSSAEVRIELSMAGEFPNSVPTGSFSLFFEMRVPPGSPPQWAPETLRRIPPPTELSWWYRNNGPATQARFQLNDVDDGTEGLRRSGIVRLRIPRDWKPESGRPSPTYAIWLKAEKATFVFPPRLVRLIPNVVIAHHVRRTAEHRFAAQNWLPLPGRSISLAPFTSDLGNTGIPQQDIPAVEFGMRLLLKERDGEWHRWRATADLYRHGPADRVFVVDRARGEIRFGDGLTGRLPVLAKPSGSDDHNVRLRYWVGGGPSGQVGARRGWEGPKGLTAVNVVAAEGGEESEDLEAARQRAAASVRRLTRAVIAPDYEELATTTPGVAIRRAHAAVGYHPAHPCTPVPGAVTVFIVPEAPREEDNSDWLEDAFVPAPVPDPGALAAVTARLEKARLLTSEMFVRAPRYHPVALRVSVDADPVDPLALEQKIRTQLQRFLDPLTGGDEGGGWLFGEPVRPSVLLREAQKAVGAVGRVSEVAIGLDGARPSESCREVRIRPHDLVWLSELSVRLNRQAQPIGGLR